MEKSKWLAPNYYKNFKCKCNDCRHSCCHGWQIPLSKQEYQNLIELECDNEFRHRLDVSFKQPDFIDEKRYRIISFNYLGDCPMQKNGLCEIHKNFGEENLPSICRLYPRSLKNVNGVNIACCSSSCEAVIEMLINDEPLKLEEIELNSIANLNYNIDSNVMEQLNHFEKILKDRSTSLVASIKQICLEVNKEEFVSDYNVNTNPLNDGLKLLNRLATANFLGDIAKAISERYEDNYYQYEIDTENFEKLFPNWMYYFENVLNNSLLYENFPFVDARFNKTLAYNGLCASYGLMRLVSIGWCAINPNKEALVDCLSALFHLIDHTAFYYNVNILSKASALLLKL